MKTFQYLVHTFNKIQMLTGAYLILEGTYESRFVFPLGKLQRSQYLYV